MRLSNIVLSVLFAAAGRFAPCSCFSECRTMNVSFHPVQKLPSRLIGNDGTSIMSLYALEHEDHADSDSKNSSSDLNRRRLMTSAIASVGAINGMPNRANASTKSRVEGYPVQKSAEEWKSILTARQFEILRDGGTERPYSSILEGEERRGVYHCAGCDTALFDSSQKFHSGTGWPSFALALEGVEVEKVSAIQANLLGAELRCASCGGHLGDVFNDGFLFVGTPAFQSGKRFCIDGAALTFRAESGTEVVGDKYPPLRSYY